MNVIKSVLSDFKDEIENMSEEEKETEKPYKIVGIVEKILKSNQRNQQGEGLKF